MTKAKFEAILATQVCSTGSGAMRKRELLCCSLGWAPAFVHSSAHTRTCRHDHGPAQGSRFHSTRTPESGCRCPTPRSGAARRSCSTPTKTPTSRASKSRSSCTSCRRASLRPLVWKDSSDAARRRGGRVEVAFSSCASCRCTSQCLAHRADGQQWRWYTTPEDSQLQAAAPAAAVCGRPAVVQHVAKACSWHADSGRASQ
jgi:hypothetical protein